MAVRPIAQLRREQQEMLDALREMETEASTATIETSPESGEPTYRLARVTQVVTSDPTYGPHLLVVPQILSGTPPTPSDRDVSAGRAYPTPNRSVSDYSADEYVAVWKIDAVWLAARLG
jgi:hypothetical protein